MGSAQDGAGPMARAPHRSVSHLPDPRAGSDISAPTRPRDRATCLQPPVTSSGCYGENSALCLDALLRPGSLWAATESASMFLQLPVPRAHAPGVLIVAQSWARLPPGGPLSHGPAS